MRLLRLLTKSSVMGINIKIMANDKTINVMVLPVEVRKQLESLNNDIDKARNAVATLKKVGVDVSSIESKLQWAEEVRTTLLAEFK